MTNKPQFVGERTTVKLSQIAKIKAGNVAPKKDAFTEDGIPFVRAGSLTNLLAGGSLADLEKIDGGTAQKLRLTLFPAGTVVFAKSGMSCMTGNVYVLPKPCYVVSHLACVIPNGNYASYLKHYFRFNRPNRLIENPSFPSIKLSKIQGIKLKLPSPEKGVRQVQALERIESQIGQAKALLTYLDSLVKSRFVEMFGDPAQNNFHWRMAPLGENAKLINGRAYKQNELLASGKYPVLRVGNFFSNRDWYYSDLELDEKKYCNNGDLLYAWSASFGPKIWDGGKVIYHYHIWKVEVGDAYNKYFLCKLLKYAEKSFLGDTHGIGMLHLTKAGMEEAPFIVPPLDLQDRFVAFVSQVNKSRFVAQQQIEKLQMLYDSLAQEYFGD